MVNLFLKFVTNNHEFSGVDVTASAAKSCHINSGFDWCISQCTARFVILHLWIFSLSVCHCICQISNHTCWHLVTPDKYWLCTVNRGGGETAINKVSWKTHVHKCTEYLKLWSKQSRATFEVKVTVYVNVSLWHCGQIIEWCMVSLKA